MANEDDPFEAQNSKDPLGDVFDKGGTPKKAPPGSPKSVPLLSPSELFSKVAKSTVMVIALDADGEPVSRASGFFFTPEPSKEGLRELGIAGNPFVVTNLHAVKWAKSVVIKPYAVDVRLPVISVLGLDLVNDLCLLEVEPQAFGRLQVAHGPVKVGDPVYVIGNPKGLEGTFSSGIVAAVRGENHIQIDAPISPGSSGGPVLNGFGELVGVATSSIIGGQNLNFAVSSRFIAEMPMVLMPVEEIGALAISDREYAHLKGPVRTYTETTTELNYSEQNEPKPGPELTSSVLTFDRSGRIIREEDYKKGSLAGRRNFEYGSNGLMSKLIIIGADGKRDEHGYDNSEDAVPTMAGFHKYSVSSIHGDVVVKFDSRGNVVEQSGKNKLVYSYDSDDREFEEKSFSGEQLKFSTHSTYEDDVYGNWTKREESFWLASFPQFGYRLENVYRRRMSYFEEQ